MNSIFCKIQEDVIDFPTYAAKLDSAARDYSGAVTWFVGNVRNINMLKDGVYHEVKGITYESFEVLAEKILNKICLEAQEQFDKKLNLLVVHRIGYLNCGECSILIGVSSLHRAPAFVASRFILEEIKKRAPIWKLEHYSSGESHWLKGQSLNEI